MQIYLLNTSALQVVLTSNDPMADSIRGEENRPRYFVGGLVMLNPYTELYNYLFEKSMLMEVSK